MVAAIVLLLAVPAAVHAAGGMYFDDFTVTNGGTSVLFDDFNDGSISDWQPQHYALTSSQVSHSPSYSMYLNWHGGSVSDAFHQMSIQQPGLVAASAWVWLPPVREQYNWSHNIISFTGIYLYSGSSDNNSFAHVELRPGETSYRIYLGWNNFGGQGATATSSAILAPQTWALLSLQMDRTSGTAAAYLNGAECLSFAYDPSHFTSFDGVSAWGWLGDGVVPEPGTFVPLLVGLVGLALRRRR